jgi:hypothetical protein
MKIAYDYFLESSDTQTFYSEKTIEWNLSVDELKYLLALQCIDTRQKAYPDYREFLDAWVKDDQVALAAYKEKCLAVKSKYPKPA